MKILITGANGFIGKALTQDLLKKGHTVYGIVTDEKTFNGLKNSNLVLHKLFFDDYDKISSLVNDDIDCVFHLAWAGLNGPSAADVKLQLSNVLATSVLIEEAKKLHAKKMVFVSSMNTLEIRDMLANPEKHNLRPVSIHVGSKLNAEIVSRTLCSINEIDFNVGLIAMVYGENNQSKMITNVVIDSLLKGVSPKLIEGNNIYDLVYVDDVVSGLESIGFKGINKKTYYVGHSSNTTFKELFTEIGNIVAPHIQLRFGEYPDDNSINFELVDRELLKKDTGWEPTANFKQSILKTAAWVKDNYGK